ncbi:MAG: NifB/NifX family molybdenum-iron cluster-binding protein [Planctomycetota bacterium]
MRIALCSKGTDLDAEPSPVFGRCPYFLFVDDETEEVTAVANAAQNAGGGAGVQAAQTVVDNGAEVVLSGRVGPRAYEVLVQAGVRTYDAGTADAREAISKFRVGALSEVTSPASSRHDHQG